MCNLLHPSPPSKKILFLWLENSASNLGAVRRWSKEAYNVGLILIIILVLLLLGALPSWPYSRSWGYYPSGGLTLVLLIVILLLLMGRI